MITSTTKRLILNSGIASLLGLALISWLHIKPLGLLFLTIFLYWAYKNKYDIEIILPENLQIRLEMCFDRIKCTRENNPGKFFAFALGILGSTALIGHLLSGSCMVLIAIVVIVFLTSKYNFRILKHKTLGQTWSDKSQENEIDEFLPEVNDNNMSVLERASDQSSAILTTEDTEEKSEEVPSELLIPDCIPEIDEHSTDEEDELGIEMPNECAPTRSQKYEIEFRKGHFKKDSSVSTSSSDEESLSKGLKFPDHSIIDHRLQNKQFIENITDSGMPNIHHDSILPSVISGVMSLVHTSGSKPIPQEEFSDDEVSDFEIVRPDEI